MSLQLSRWSPRSSFSGESDDDPLSYWHTVDTEPVDRARVATDTSSIHRQATASAYQPIASSSRLAEPARPLPAAPIKKSSAASARNSSSAVPLIDFTLPVKAHPNRFPGLSPIDYDRPDKTLSRTVDYGGWDFLLELAEEDDGSLDVRGAGDGRGGPRKSLSRLDLQEALFYSSGDEEDYDEHVEVDDERTPPPEIVDHHPFESYRDDVGRRAPQSRLLDVEKGPRSGRGAHKVPWTALPPDRVKVPRSLEWTLEEDLLLGRHAARFVERSTNLDHSLTISDFAREVRLSSDFARRDFLPLMKRFTEHIEEYKRQLERNAQAAAEAESSEPESIVERPARSSAHKRKVPSPERGTTHKARQPSAADRSSSPPEPASKSRRIDETRTLGRPTLSASTSTSTAPAHLPRRPDQSLPPSSRKVIDLVTPEPDDPSRSSAACRSRPIERPSPVRPSINLKALVGPAGIHAPPGSSTIQPRPLAHPSAVHDSPSTTTTTSPTTKGKEREVPRGPRRRDSNSFSPPPASPSRRMTRLPSDTPQPGFLSSVNTIPVTRRWGPQPKIVSPEPPREPRALRPVGRVTRWDSQVPLAPSQERRVSDPQAGSLRAPLPSRLERDAPPHLSPIRPREVTPAGEGYHPDLQGQTRLQNEMDSLGDDDAALMDEIITHMGTHHPACPLPPIETLLPTVALLRSSARPLSPSAQFVRRDPPVLNAKKVEVHDYAIPPGSTLLTASAGPAPAADAAAGSPLLVLPVEAMSAVAQCLAMFKVPASA